MARSSLYAVFFLLVLSVELFSVSLGSTLLRTKPRIWEVDEIEAFGSHSDMAPEEEDQLEMSENQLDDSDDFSGPYRDDERDIGLCVPRKHCANRDGAGLIEPRKNRCPKHKVFCPVDDLEDYPMCGISKPNLIRDRIMSTSSKTKSALGEWPWLAMIIERRGDDDWYLCNGVLIDNWHLVTVAHCFDKSESLDIKVLLGVHELYKERDKANHFEIEADTIVLHPNFTSKNLRNDLAVVRLKQEVIFNEHISPICIPSPIEVRKFQVASNRHMARCFTTGWGMNSAEAKNEDLLLEVPNKVSLPLQPHDQCEKKLRRTKLGKRFELHRSFLCAGGEHGNDACYGDGGSPLACQQEDGAFTLVGLVSWGIGCGQSDVPGVYTNVGEFVDFIEQCKNFIADEL